jgi:hypothetical protein
MGASMSWLTAPVLATPFADSALPAGQVVSWPHPLGRAVVTVRPSARQVPPYPYENVTRRRGASPGSDASRA